MTPQKNQDVPQKNLESAIRLYDELQQVTSKAGKQTEFLKLSIKYKVTKELLDSVNDDLKGLYNWVVDKTQDNNEQDTAGSTLGDPTDVKFTNISDKNNTHKTAKVAKKTEKKMDKIDRIIERKTGLDGVDGLVAAINSLNGEVRSAYPELFGSQHYHNAKQEAQKMIESGEINPDQIKQQYEKEVKSGKSPESAAKAVMTDAYNKSTNWLVDKANFDPGVAKAAVIGFAIWGVLKGYPAIRDVFPSGIGGFLLMGLTAYAAAKNIPGGKVMDAYEGIFGPISGREKGVNGSVVANTEISYMKLESSEFQNGQLFFAGLIKYLKDPKDDWIMKTYYVDNKFDITQFIADYEAGVVGYEGPKTVKHHELRQKFKITAQSDLFMGFVAGRVDGPNGEKIVSGEINAFLSGIVGDNYGSGNLTSIKGIVDQNATYQEINKKRYQILKNAGYEIDMTKGDKRNEIDAIINTKARDIDYKLTQDDKQKLQSLIDNLVLVSVVVENSEIDNSDSVTIDKLLSKNIISLRNNEKSTINQFKQAFAHEDSKYGGAMKFGLLGTDEEKYQPTIDIEGIGQFPVTITPSGMSLGFEVDTDQEFVPKAIRGMEFSDPDKFFEMVGMMITKIMPMRYKSKTSSAITRDSTQNTLRYFSTGSMRGLTFKKDHSVGENSLLDNVLVDQQTIKRIFPNKETTTVFVDWLNTNFMVGELPIWDIQAPDIDYFYSGSKAPNTSASNVDRDQTTGEKVKASLRDGVNYSLEIAGIIGSGAKKGLIEALEGTGDVGKKLVRELGELTGVGITELNKLVPQGFKVVNTVVEELGKTFSKMSDTSINGFMGGLGKLIKSGVITAGSTSQQIMKELGALTGVGMDEIKEVFAKHGLHKGGFALIGHLIMGVLAYRFTKYGFKQSDGETAAVLGKAK